MSALDSLTDDELHLTLDMNKRLCAIIDAVEARGGLNSKEAHELEDAIHIRNGLTTMRHGSHDNETHGTAAQNAVTAKDAAETKGPGRA